MRTIDSVVAGLKRPRLPQLPAPEYRPRQGRRMAFAVENMSSHMTDEGWQIMRGLENSGYLLAGRRLTIDETDVRVLLKQSPSTVLLQDKREWDVRPGDFRDQSARFVHVDRLKGCGAFVATVLKDAQNNPPYHSASAAEIGCHAWVVYYHPKVVAHVASFVRPQHLVRTYHSVDSAKVPPFKGREKLAVLSGALGPAYPLRLRLTQHPLAWDVLKHPGYHNRGCATPAYLDTLAKYRVAICTSSMYGYALRKIVEATACGCMVVTDLPEDEVMPGIDGNLYRVDSGASPEAVADLVRSLKYDESVQASFARRAKDFYDVYAVGRRLADDLEALRNGYSAGAI